MLAFCLIRFNYFFVGGLKWKCKPLLPFIPLTNDEPRRDRELLSFARDKTLQ